MERFLTDSCDPVRAAKASGNWTQKGWPYGWGNCYLTPTVRPAFLSSVSSSLYICWSEPTRFRYFWFVLWPFLELNASGSAEKGRNINSYFRNGQKWTKIKLRIETPRLPPSDLDPRPLTLSHLRKPGRANILSATETKLSYPLLLS